MSELFVLPICFCVIIVYFLGLEWAYPMAGTPLTNMIKHMLKAIREAGSDDYVMTPQEAEALFGENAPKPRPKVEPKSLPKKSI